MKILDFYERLLATLGVEVGGHDELLFNGEVHIPLKYRHPIKGIVEGKLYLPTDKVLRLKEDPTVVKFHPTGESCHRLPSEVYNRLEKLVLAKVNTLFISAANTIFDVSMHSDCHDACSLDAMELIRDSSGEYKSQHVTYWNRIQKLVGERLATEHMGAIGFSMVRNKQLNSKRYNRIMSVTDSLADELEKEQPFDIKPPNKVMPDRLRAIYGHVLNFDVANGTNCNRCPNLEVLLATYGDMALHFYKIFPAFEGAKDIEDELVDVSWIKEIKHLAKMHSRDLDIELPGNIGIAASREEQEVVKVEAIRRNIISDAENDEEPEEDGETEAMRRRAIRAAKALERKEVEKPKVLQSQSAPPYQAPYQEPAYSQPPPQPQTAPQEMSAEDKLMRGYGKPQMAQAPVYPQYPPQQPMYGPKPTYSQQQQPPAYGQQPPQYPAYSQSPPPYAQPPAYGYPNQPPAYGSPPPPNYETPQYPPQNQGYNAPARPAYGNNQTPPQNYGYGQPQRAPFKP